MGKFATQDTAAQFIRKFKVPRFILGRHIPNFSDDIVAISGFFQFD